MHEDNQFSHWGTISSPGGLPSQFEVFSLKFQPRWLWQQIEHSDMDRSSLFGVWIWGNIAITHFLTVKNTPIPAVLLQKFFKLSLLQTAYTNPNHISQSKALDIESKVILYQNHQSIMTKPPTKLRQFQIIRKKGILIAKLAIEISKTTKVTAFLAFSLILWLGKEKPSSYSSYRSELTENLYSYTWF